MSTITPFLRFLKESLEIVRACPRWRDKLALSFARATRPGTYLVNAVSRATFGRELLRPYAFLFWDILIQNEDGVFHCRKRTVDFGKVSTSWEKSLRPLFQLDQGVFIDIGAHVGRYAVMVARQLGPRGTVIAIEPEPDNFGSLLRNIEINGLRNIIPMNVACHSANGPLTLYLHPFDDGMHSLVWPLSKSALAIQGRTLDSLLEELQIGEVSLMKIDVEGAETEVLKGATQTIQRSPRVRIILEASSEGPVTMLTSLGLRVEAVSGIYYLAWRTS